METPRSRIIGVAVAATTARAQTSFAIAKRPAVREDFQRLRSNFEQIPSNRLNVQAASKAAPVPNKDGVIMCEKCVEIDKAVARYQGILLSIGDPVTVDRTRELIADLQAQKVALHPEPDQSRGDI